ncbi:MAG: ABC transporter substrate-binding protein [Crenarchaeota archaeon]|jgi:iron complex transport system substrate-binding protein|nr:ABC transporter substrate-binding protein [Thermoproteota archaeon]
MSGKNMETKPTLYITTILIIATILASGYISTIKINELETIIDTQASKLNSYNQILDNQAEQLKSVNQRITDQNTILEQYNQTINLQNQTISHQNETISQQKDEIQKFKPITLVDDAGYMITITSYPERIVSLAPSNTEILFAVGAGDRVVGVTDWCNYPYDFSEWIKAGNMSSIGNYWNPSIEPILSLRPDLVLASTDSSGDVAASLRNLGYNVLILDGDTLNEVLNDVFLVGRATNQTDQATTLVSSLRTRIDTVVNTVKNAESTPKVYYELWNDPLMAAGPRTFVSDLISLAGGQNIFDDAASQWPIVSSESVISKNPDIILSHDAEIKTRTGWYSINAVANNKIYQFDDDLLVRPVPRLVDALENLAEIIHPELFGSH